MDGTWMNPARGFERRNIIELGAKVGEVGAIATTFVTGLEKAGMVARAADGLEPLEDSLMVEQAGRLIPVVSGVLWPAAQLSAFILLGFAVAVLLVEELQGESLRALDVDVGLQRRRRINTAALLALCVLLMASPPLPGVYG